MNPHDYAIVLHVGTRVVAFDAAWRDTTRPVRAFDVTTLPRKEVAMALDERYQDAHARFVFAEQSEWTALR